jgi:hypothetical protein
MLLSVIGAASASAGRSPSAAARASGHASTKGFAPNLTILYNQLNNAGAVGLVSQDFTDAGFDVYDSYIADDFSVPGSLTLGWKVQGMRAAGVWFGGGTGPCDSVNVAFYKDAAGLPGAQTGTTQSGASSPSATFTVVFPTAQKLAKGFTYWASMWCTMAFTPGGEWGWTDRTVTSNSPATWENPGGGFATPCTTWTAFDACFAGANDGDDAEFALAGGAV